MEIELLKKVIRVIDDMKKICEEKMEMLESKDCKKQFGEYDEYKEEELGLTLDVKLAQLNRTVEKMKGM